MIESSASKKIFVLRNNDLGDVLVATPLLHGLKKAFPSSHISIGVGDWAKPLLKENPDIDEIVSCNGPWHNKQICHFPPNSPKTFLHGLFYILLSKETRRMAKAKYTHGIDVLGSRQGAWLLRRIGIPLRLGVTGYAGGNKWCKQTILFDENRNVAEAALGFLPLLGIDQTIEPRPRIYLSEKEKTNSMWKPRDQNTKRIIIAPGGGFLEKCWGNKKFSSLVNALLKNILYEIKVVGTTEDKERIKLFENSRQDRFHNHCGNLGLRETTAMVSDADLVICNSSLCMHLAGAFKIPSITLLGDWYQSAKLHHIQWGYPEGVIIGKEENSGRNSVASVNEVLNIAGGILS